ncbi:hypothetical protein Tco_0901457 [Tanacetum coccineum]
MVNTFEAHPSLMVVIVNRRFNIFRRHGTDLMGLFTEMGKRRVDIRFWRTMVGRQHFYNLTFQNVCLETQKNILVALKLSHDDLLCSFRRAPRAGAEELQYIQLVKIMEGITLFDSKDRWRWSLEDFRCEAMDIESIICPLCEKNVESSSLIFFTYPISREIFRKVLLWWEIDVVMVSSYDEWKQCVAGGPKKGGLGVSSLLLLTELIDEMEGSGEFSVASIRRFNDGATSLDGGYSNTLWIKSVPNKVNFLAWKNPIGSRFYEI